MSDGSSVPVPQSWQELDRLLGDLRRSRATLEIRGGQFDRRIQAIQAEKAAECGPLKEVCDAQEAAILLFLAAHKGDIPRDRRTVTMVHGKAGVRLSPVKIELVEPEDEVLRRLAQRGHHGALSTTTKVVKAKLKDLSPGELQICGIALSQEETVFYELSDTPLVDYPEVSGGA